MTDHSEGWWKYAYVGQKVVYIVDYEPSRFGHRAERGNTYTVEAIKPSSAWQVRWRPLLPDGIAIKVAEDGCWYPPHRFRPAHTKSTDTGMAILKRALNSTPVREKA